MKHTVSLNKMIDFLWMVLETFGITLKWTTCCIFQRSSHILTFQLKSVSVELKCFSIISVFVASLTPFISNLMAVILNFWSYREIELSMSGDFSHITWPGEWSLSVRWHNACWWPQATCCRAVIPARLETQVAHCCTPPQLLAKTISAHCALCQQGKNKQTNNPISSCLPVFCLSQCWILLLPSGLYTNASYK